MQFQTQLFASQCYLFLASICYAKLLSSLSAHLILLITMFQANMSEDISMWLITQLLHCQIYMNYGHQPKAPGFKLTKIAIYHFKPKCERCLFRWSNQSNICLAPPFPHMQILQTAKKMNCRHECKTQEQYCSSISVCEKHYNNLICTTVDQKIPITGNCNSDILFGTLRWAAWTWLAILFHWGVRRFVRKWYIFFNVKSYFCNNLGFGENFINVYVLDYWETLKKLWIWTWTEIYCFAGPLLPFSLRSIPC